MHLLSALIGLTLTLSPGASAASPVCQSLEGREPIGKHYVTRVLRRADDSIAFAHDESEQSDDLSGDDLLYGFFPVTEIASHAWLAMIDAQITVEDSAAELEQQTACLAYDKALIECKMQEVREAMDKVLATGKSGMFLSMFQLSSALRLLQQSHRHVTAGAKDPAYVDTTFTQLSFLDDPDDEVWCCLYDYEEDDFDVATRMSQYACEWENDGEAYETLEGALGAGCYEDEDYEDDDLPPEEESLCPFHSNYTEPFMNGYGCDEVSLGAIQDVYPPAKAELESLQTLVADFEKYQSRTHKEAFGCSLKLGFCEFDESRRCGGDQECEVEDAGLCVVPAGRCSGNALVGCDEDKQCEDLGIGACVYGNDAKVPLRATHTPFAIKPNWFTLIWDFVQKRVQHGGSREYPDDIKLPGEFPEDKRDMRTEVEIDGMYAQNVAEPRYRRWQVSVEQGKDEAAIYPLSSDKGMVGQQALQKEIDRFKKLARDKEGVRRLLIDTAFFLRISCIHRPCAKRLEHILKLAFTDECFPFTEGDFESDEEEPDGETRWKKCMEKAEIEIE